MKVLIISLPRTGSTSLMNKISSENKLTCINEPWGMYSTDSFNYLNDYDNIIVKTIINQKPPNIEDRISFLFNFSKKFDEVILLSRKNLIECSQSLAFLLYNYPRGFTHDKEYVWEKTPNYDSILSHIYESNSEIKLLSKKLNISISYYEDIFDVNSINRSRKFKKNIL